MTTTIPKLNNLDFIVAVGSLLIDQAVAKAVGDLALVEKLQLNINDVIVGSKHPGCRDYFEKYSAFLRFYPEYTEFFFDIRGYSIPGSPTPFKDWNKILSDLKMEDGKLLPVHAYFDRLDKEIESYSPFPIHSAQIIEAATNIGWKHKEHRSVNEVDSFDEQFLSAFLTNDPEITSDDPIVMEILGIAADFREKRIAEGWKRLDFANSLVDMLDCGQQDSTDLTKLNNSSNKTEELSPICPSLWETVLTDIEAASAYIGSRRCKVFQCRFNALVEQKLVQLDQESPQMRHSFLLAAKAFGYAGDGNKLAPEWQYFLDEIGHRAFEGCGLSDVLWQRRVDAFIGDKLQQLQTESHEKYESFLAAAKAHYGYGSEEDSEPFEFGENDCPLTGIDTYCCPCGQHP